MQNFFWSIFPVIVVNYSVNLLIQFKYGKIRTRKTQNSDIFYAVQP